MIRLSMSFLHHSVYKCAAGRERSESASGLYFSASEYSSPVSMSFVPADILPRQPDINIIAIADTHNSNAAALDILLFIINDLSF